jgi:hypothetical protein
MIYLIITTSIYNKHGRYNPTERVNRYIDCITSSLKCIADRTAIKPIIVENNGERRTFLDDFDCDVLYTDNNDLEAPHKGVNELLDINDVIRTYNIQDDDYIIKLTGRYKLLNDSFFKVVLDNIDTYDAFIKFMNVCTLQYCEDDCILGLFAIKCKYLKGLYYTCEKSPEMEFATHVKKTVPRDKIMEMTHLEMEFNFLNDNKNIII